MHPSLKQMAAELDRHARDPGLRWRFACACVQEVADQLEDEQAIQAWQRLQALVSAPGEPDEVALRELALHLEGIARAHPGSRSIDGTRHAAVSATHALAQAAHGRAIEAAAYAAYSKIYGYGAYAVSDPQAFDDVHQHQWQLLQRLLPPADEADPLR